jgi:hypothetical protein
MSRTRWFFLAIVVLVGIAPLMILPGAVGAEPNPNKPIVLPIDSTFPSPTLTNRCGVDVWTHLTGTFAFKVLPNGVEHDRIRTEYVFSGPGGSFAVKHIENVKYSATFSPDGTLVETITATGQLRFHVVVPGYGTLDNNSGREVLQITWQFDEELGEYVEVDFQVLFDAGPNDESSDADYAVLCAILA